MTVALGAHTFGFIWSDTPETAIEKMAKAGCSCVQLMATPPHFDPWRPDAARTKRLRAALDAAGLRLLALDLSSGDVNLASPSADVRAFSIAAYRHAIERATELDAPAVCIGSGRRHALFPGADRELMDGFRVSFAEAHAFAAQRGVRLLIENHPQGLLARAETICAFLADEGYDEIGIIYDVANAAAAGEDPAEGARALAGRLSIVHLSDAPAGQWRHDPIGSGAIDFNSIARVVGGIGFGGPVVLEIIAPDPGAALVEGRRRLEGACWRFRCRDGAGVASDQ